MCLPLETTYLEVLEDTDCVEYIINTDPYDPDQDNTCYLCPLSSPSPPPTLCQASLSPRSMDSGLGDEVTTFHLLQPLITDTFITDDDDDDASVMLDLMDLSFLDQKTPEESDFDLVDDLNPLKAGPAVIVAQEPGLFMELSDHSHSPLSPPRSPSPNSSALVPCTPTTHALHTNATIINRTISTDSGTTTGHNYSDDTELAANVSLHYYDSSSIIAIHKEEVEDFPSSPHTSRPKKTSTVKKKTRQTKTGEEKEDDDDEEEDDGFWAEDDDDDDDDAGYKPYCDSRRGAKRNLLWKFLLWVLDKHADLAQWTDMNNGVFKFLNTSRLSTLWGRRKQKPDMTFEKLSRGIRHYYKKGLMERLSSTRLVYKFNWKMVPRRYRKG